MYIWYLNAPRNLRFDEETETEIQKLSSFGFENYKCTIYPVVWNNVQTRIALQVNHCNVCFFSVDQSKLFACCYSEKF